MSNESRGRGEVADPGEVAAIYGEVAELAATARREFLDLACGDRPALRAEVESLLAAHASAEGFLEPSAGEVLLGVDRELSPGEGKRAGPYRLLSEIGRGGMGTVYLAERADGAFEQRVALKVIRRDLGSPAMLDRFLRERQILARLEHPNIARLLDGGVTEDGSPYFAMELLRGAPLSTYCDTHRLSIAARLELVCQACGAVQHAHSSLVVHRDLKPSNILVGEDGTLKLLDFGIAKLLDDAADADDAAAAAPTAAFTALTPDYAAPEQLRGAVVTTASDVYSLGVVLYELLTGRLPRRWERGTFAASDAVAAGPRDQPTTPPSVAVGRPAVERNTDGALIEIAPEQIAAARGTRPDSLRRCLRGDLDAILIRALRPDAAMRYPSAEALAADLRRHQAGLPVEARRGTLAYRGAKFVHRHRLGVAAATVVLAALALGLVSTVWQAERASREAQRALAVQRFLVELFERADPTRTLGETVTARQILDEAARRLRSESSGDIMIRAELADTLARTYRGLGLLDEAASWADEATVGFRRALGPGASRAALAELTREEVRVDRGEVAAARAPLDVLLPRLVEDFGAGSAEHIRARSARAALLVHSGETDAALVEERAILDDTRRLYGEGHVETAAQLGDVASALGSLSRFAEAEAALLEARSRLERAGALGGPQGTHVETELAAVLEIVGRFPEAEQRFLAALETGRAALGTRHPQVAQIWIKYGLLLQELGRPVEARTALEEAISILEPLGHYDAGAALRYLGFGHMTLEQFDEASAVFARAEKVLRARLGDDHPLTWAAVVTSAFANAKRGEVALGERRLREALVALERLHGKDSDDVRVPRKYFGEVLRLGGNPEEAEATHRRILELERRLFGREDHPSVVGTKHHLALDLLEMNRGERLAEARQLVDEALVFLRARDPSGTRTGDALVTSGRIYAAQGDPIRAATELSEAIELLAAVRGEDAPSTRAARRALAALKS